MRTYHESESPRLTYLCNALGEPTGNGDFDDAWLASASEDIETEIGVWLGNYVVAYQGRRYYAPSLELSFRTADNQDQDLPQSHNLLPEMRRYARDLWRRTRDAQAKIIIEPNAGMRDRHTLILLLPMDPALQGMLPGTNLAEKVALLCNGLATPDGGSHA